MRREKKRNILIFAAVMMCAFALTACGRTSNSGGETTAAGDVSGGNTAGSAAETESKDTAEDSAGGIFNEAGELVFGNEPNNLVQSSISPCFGNGRLYYIDEEAGNLMSYALDGSDRQVVETREDFKNGGITCLNWYDGAVYYLSTQEQSETEDTSEYVPRKKEIRKVDTQTGEDSLVKQYDDTTGGGRMLIIGDSLFLSYMTWDAQHYTAELYLDVYNLETGASNTMMHLSYDKIDSMDNGLSTQITASENDLYLLIFNREIKDLANYIVYRAPLTSAYNGEADWESCANTIGTRGVLLAADGIYHAPIDLHTDKGSFQFHRFEAFGETWQGEVILDNLSPYAGNTSSQIWYSNNYILGGGLVLVGEKILYSETADYSGAKVVGELDKYYKNLENWRMGAYEDVVYIILVEDGGATIHTLTADGVYQ